MTDIFVYASTYNHNFILVGTYPLIITLTQSEFSYEKIKLGIIRIAFIIKVKHINDA